MLSTLTDLNQEKFSLIWCQKVSHSDIWSVNHVNIGPISICKMCILFIKCITYFLDSMRRWDESSGAVWGRCVWRRRRPMRWHHSEQVSPALCYRDPVLFHILVTMSPSHNLDTKHLPRTQFHRSTSCSAAVNDPPCFLAGVSWCRCLCCAPAVPESPSWAEALIIFAVCWWMSLKWSWARTALLYS